jgi:hypothetical protein
MLVDDNSSSNWDQIDGLVDFATYNQETANALEEQHLNIEFKN